MFVQVTVQLLLANSQGREEFVDRLFENGIHPVSGGITTESPSF